MADPTPKYYECHITVDPVVGDREVVFDLVTRKHGFRMADLLKKTGAPSDVDMFCTGRGKTFQGLAEDMDRLLAELRDRGFTLRRWKIEGVMLDSRAGDVR